MAAAWESPSPVGEKFIADQRRFGRLPDLAPALESGEVADPVRVDPGTATKLMVSASLRAAGLYRPTTRMEVMWVEGERELVLVVGDLRLELAEGLIMIWIPVRCDPVGTQLVSVAFAVGAPGRPAGLFASTERRPRGPQLVVDAWGEHLVAFAWQCLLGLVSGLAAAVGKDGRGNLLVPVELEASSDGLTILPMARHRFSGSSDLAPSRQIVRAPQ